MPDPTVWTIIRGIHGIWTRYVIWTRWIRIPVTIERNFHLFFSPLTTITNQLYYSGSRYFFFIAISSLSFLQSFFPYIDFCVRYVMLVGSCVLRALQGFPLQVKLILGQNIRLWYNKGADACSHSSRTENELSNPDNFPVVGLHIRIFELVSAS